MKYIFFAVMIIAAMCFYSFRHHTNMASAERKRAKIIEEKMLWGKWRSNIDDNNILVFKPSICLDYYGKRIIDTLRYSLGKTCDIADTGKRITLFDAYLIYFNADTTFKECNEILNLDKSTLSYKNNVTGTMHVFYKIEASNR